MALPEMRRANRPACWLESDRTLGLYFRAVTMSKVLKDYLHNVTSTDRRVIFSALIVSGGFAVSKFTGVLDDFIVARVKMKSSRCKVVLQSTCLKVLTGKQAFVYEWAEEAHHGSPRHGPLDRPRENPRI